MIEKSKLEKWLLARKIVEEGCVDYANKFYTAFFGTETNFTEFDIIFYKTDFTLGYDNLCFSYLVLSETDEEVIKSAIKLKDKKEEINSELQRVAKMMELRKRNEKV